MINYLFPITVHMQALCTALAERITVALGLGQMPKTRGSPNSCQMLEKLWPWHVDQVSATPSHRKVSVDHAGFVLHLVLKRTFIIAESFLSDCFLVCLQKQKLALAVFVTNRSNCMRLHPTMPGM